jgi:cyclophilin family peptidyl-prolyl cis-trans isomerase
MNKPESRRKLLKAALFSFAFGFLVFTPSCTCTKKEKLPDATQVTPPSSQQQVENTMVIETEYGNIEIELFPKEAPKTVARISELANKGFYNGLTFHRVVPGFVVQGGDPLGNGTGGSGQNLPAEFNAHKHVEGSVAMARAADPNSADSQFYIALGTIPHLDGSYTVFGQVKSGMDSVKKIKVGDKMKKVSVK